jgi:hypothetical protein
MHCGQCQIEGAKLVNLDGNNNFALHCPHVGLFCSFSSNSILLFNPRYKKIDFFLKFKFKK